MLAVHSPFTTAFIAKKRRQNKLQLIVFKVLLETRSVVFITEDIPEYYTLLHLQSKRNAEIIRRALLCPIEL